MSGSRSDASTSTDDVKGRPLCLFYFTHPFGVLSPEPPALAPAPPHVARAFVNMRPWGDPAAPWPDPSGPWGSPAAPWGSPGAPWASPGGPWGSHGGVWGSGDTSYSYASRSSPDRNAPLVAAPAPHRESLSSSLFSGEAWWSPAARRPPPYGKLLPPLRLPASLDPSTLDGSEDFWPIKCMNPEKFSLPPIEMPTVNVVTWSGTEGERTRSRRGRMRRRRLGVSKPRRADLRRSLAGLMRRVLAGARAAPLSPTLRHALRTLRDAWPDPARPHSKSSSDSAWLATLYPTQEIAPATLVAPAPAPAPAMPERAPLAPRASPGLLRRRYSVPETIMRKYRLAQQRSDSEDESASPTERTATCASTQAAVAAARHSATLRRAAPPCRACCCCSRSLEASRAELRASASPRRAADMLRAAMRNSYERAGDARFSADTYRSHMPRPRPDPSADSPSRFSRASSAETSPSEPNFVAATVDDSGDRPHLPERLHDCEETRSDSTVSPPTAVELTTVSIRPTPAASYEMLEIVVSETLSGVRGGARVATPPRRALVPPAPARDQLDLDEYVSNILVESLNSLTDQLENMTASMDADRRVSIVEKEIKVKLQNAAVNTIVHLSPTSNNQIIFGNEELGGIGMAGGEENNVGPRDTRDVLRQIGRLFHGAATTPGEASDVDEYLLEREALEGPLGSVGPCNYFTALEDNAAVSRFSAFPHTVSMEVNASSSEEPDPGGSECTSLVDSLDDPNSPRVAPSHRPSPRVPGDVLALLPEDAPPREPEAFFVKIQGDACECVSDEASVAARMPDKIRQRLHRRNRKRELRMECLRRGRGRSARQAQARAERAARALLDALLDDVILQVARDEHRAARQRRRVPPEPMPRPTPAASRTDAPRKDTERHRVRGKLSLVARPVLPADDRAAKRIYQKSEIREGDKCVEILEILEYVNGARSSPESVASDENHQFDSKTKKSRIPIPINEKSLKSPVTDSRKMDWGRASSRTPDTGDETSNKIAEMLARALGSPQHELPESPPRAAPAPLHPVLTLSRPASRESDDSGRRASVPHESRSRSNSLRFRRVFDMIPEERAAGPDEHESDRRASAPDLAAPSPPAPVRLHRATNTSPALRSAATSPPAPRARRATRSEEALDNGENGEVGAHRSSRERRAPRPPHPSPRRRPHRTPAASAAILDRHGERTTRRERSEEESTSPTCREAREVGESAGGGDDDSSRSSGSGGSLLCPLAPRWLAPRRRAARTPRAPPHADPPLAAGAGGAGGAGGWSVTVAGSCRAALPQDVEMRLRFPQERATPCQECSCAHCVACSCGARPATHRAAPHRASSHRAPPLARTDSSKLTLTMKKEALDSSILASKSTRKASEPLPEVETYRASRSKLKSSVKMRRGYSLHCWLPDGDDAPIRENEGGLSVLGSAIVPELKPRARTMSERDLTRAHPPRCPLRC